MQMLYVFLLILSLLQFAVSLVHDLQITKDDRNLFKIETFGFVAGGKGINAFSN